MKYVDWINQEYAHGDYSMIEAYVVAADFPDSVVNKRMSSVSEILLKVIDRLKHVLGISVI